MLKMSPDRFLIFTGVIIGLVVLVSTGYPEERRKLVVYYDDSIKSNEQSRSAYGVKQRITDRPNYGTSFRSTNKPDYGCSCPPTPVCQTEDEDVAGPNLTVI